jgi:hypothetical protein
MGRPDDFAKEARTKEQIESLFLKMQLILFVLN